MNCTCFFFSSLGLIYQQCPGLFGSPSLYLLAFLPYVFSRTRSFWCFRSCFFLSFFFFQDSWSFDLSVNVLMLGNWTCGVIPNETLGFWLGFSDIVPVGVSRFCVVTEAPHLFSNGNPGIGVTLLLNDWVLQGLHKLPLIPLSPRNMKMSCSCSLFHLHADGEEEVTILTLC